MSITDRPNRQLTERIRRKYDRNARFYDFMDRLIKTAGGSE